MGDQANITLQELKKAADGITPQQAADNIKATLEKV